MLRSALGGPSQSIRRHAAAPSIRMMAVEGSGTSTLAETIALTPDSVRLPPTDEQLTQIFQAYDTSGDGYLDLGELQAALARAGKAVSRERAAEIMLQVDANGDGQISLDELKQAFQLEAPGEGLARLLDVFVDDVRFEISSTPFNGPILFTATTAALLGLSWKYIAAVSSLYQTDASWLPESLKLLQTIPLGFLADYARAVELAPLLTMACTSAFAYGVGDLVAQRVEGRWRVGQLDLGRSARNAALGFGLHGPLVYGWIQLLEGPFSELMGGAAGGAGEWTSLLLKIVLDQTLFSALLNILYASLNGILSGLSPREAFARARQVLVPAMVSSWRFWPAVQLISYSPLIPVDFKLLWIDTMEILWVAYLSATVNSQPGELDAIPWGEGRLVDRSGAGAAVVVLDEPGDSELLYVGPLALFGSLAALAALSWPALVIELMTA